MRKFLKRLMPFGGAIASAVPGLGVALGMVNEFLPPDRKLPETSTGQDIMDAYSNDIDESSREALDSRTEVELATLKAEENMLNAMVSVEDKGSNTRPKIALIMTWAVVVESGAYLLLMFMSLAYAILCAPEHGDKALATVDLITGAWPAFAALITPKLSIIGYYFGRRTMEKKSRYAAATGVQSVGPMGGLISMIMNRRK